MSFSSHCIGCSSIMLTHGLMGEQSVITCDSCGLIYASEFFSLNYQNAYLEGDTLYSDHLKVLDRFQNEPDIVKLLLPFERRILDLVIHSHELMHIVDVGCGTGRFLRAIEEVSLSATGYEVAEVLVQRLRHYGRQVVQGGIADFLAAEKQHCDALCLLEVVEHLESPGQSIRNVLELKKPKLLFVVVPNYRVRRIFDGRFARHDVPPNHLSWWNKPSLKNLLSECGYKVRVESIPETRRSLLGHLSRKFRGEKSESGLSDWIGAFMAPPTFWLLGVAEKQ